MHDGGGFLYYWIDNLCGDGMSVFTKCGAECVTCDCGRSDNPCKYKDNKRKGRLKALGIIDKPVATKRRESKADKKKRRKKGRK